MKICFIYLFSLLLFSCNQRSPTNNADVTDGFKDIYVTDNAEIIGSWTMCSAFENSILTQYNVCPNVSFLNNGSGYVGNTSTPSERFGWTLKKGVLNILYDTHSTNSTFPDTSYNAIIKKQDQQSNLIISHPKKNNVFYLSQ
jgi:hypothetical protein